MPPPVQKCAFWAQNHIFNERKIQKISAPLRFLPPNFQYSTSLVIFCVLFGPCNGCLFLFSTHVVLLAAFHFQYSCVTFFRTPLVSFALLFFSVCFSFLFFRFLFFHLVLSFLWSGLFCCVPEPGTWYASISLVLP